MAEKFFRMIKVDEKAFLPLNNIKWIKLFNNQLTSIDLKLMNLISETIECLDIHSELISISGFNSLC